MAFQVPKFNMWLSVQKQHSGGMGAKRYIKGQVRGARPNLVGRFYNLASQLYDLPYVEILLPAGADVRSYQFANDSTIGPIATDGEFVKGLGKLNYGWTVMAVFDVGAGFHNEFRVALGRQVEDHVTGHVDDGGMGRLNPDLLPPDGYTAVPILARAAP